MSQSLDLFRLQRIDSRRDQAAMRIREIEQILQADETIRSAQEIVKAVDTSLKTAQTSLSHAEDAVVAQKIKIEQTEASLYGGAVRNPKELQDLQSEVASLKKYLAALEDRQLDTMIALDQAVEDHKKAVIHLDLARESFEKKQGGLLQERDGLIRELAKLDSERQAAANQIPKANLVIYDRLRQQKRGVAVASVIDRSCEACGATLTPAEWQAARNAPQFTYCPSCARILYAG